jgi:predicted  nucleic acid-binding Zn-ribbon protein
MGQTDQNVQNNQGAENAQQLELSINQLQSEVAALRSTVQTLTHQNELLNSTIEAQKHQFEALSTQNGQNTQNDTMQLQQQCAQLTTERDQLTAQLSQIQHQNEELISVQSKNAEEQSKNEQQTAQLQQQLTTYMQHAQELEQGVYQQIVAALESGNNTLQQYCASNSLDLTSSQPANVGGDGDEQQPPQTQEREKTGEEQLLLSYNQLQTSFGDLSVQLLSAQQQVANNGNNIKQYTDHITTLEQHYQQSLQQIQQYVEYCNDAQQSINSSTQQIATLQEEIGQLRSQLDSTQQELTKLQLSQSTTVGNNDVNDNQSVFGGSSKLSMGKGSHKGTVVKRFDLDSQMASTSDSDDLDDYSSSDDDENDDVLRSRTMLSPHNPSNKNKNKNKRRQKHGNQMVPLSSPSSLSPEQQLQHQQLQSAIPLLQDTITELLDRCKLAEQQLTLLQSQGIDIATILQACGYNPSTGELLNTTEQNNALVQFDENTGKMLPTVFHHHQAGIQNDKGFAVIPLHNKNQLNVVIACSKLFLTTFAGVLASVIGASVVAQGGL